MAPEGSEKKKDHALKKIELDRKIMENAGVLGALSDGSNLDGVFGSSGLDSSLSGGIGGLIGAKGTQIGSGGLGMRGSGLGGGGSAAGIGGLGTRGRGGGGYGGIAKAKPRPRAALKLDALKVSGKGTLEREIIRRILRQKAGALKYCYERELIKTTDLEGGKLRVQFKIDSQGRVSEARTVGKKAFNDAIASCSVRVLKRLRFPTPKGGEVAVVQDLKFETLKPKAP